MSDTLKAILFIAVLGIAIAVFIFRQETEATKSAEEPSRALAAAIDANDPAAAPGDTGVYVKGVRGYFGRVKSARFLGVHTEHFGSGLNRSTSQVSELLLRTKRGAAVLELDFESATSRNDQQDTIDSVTELEPGDVRSDLGARTKAAVKRGFARRGRTAASSSDLDGTFPASRRRRPGRKRAAAPPSQTPGELARDRKRRQTHLECIQRANGDVDKMTRCR